MKILVAGMGNVLHGDDGFGVAVANALGERPLPEGVKVVDVGIGGIHLVQELLEGYDALVIVDAVDRDAEPGTLFDLEPRVPELAEYTDEERYELLTDMHHTVPSRVMILARALGSLPKHTWIVGCQPRAIEAPGIELSKEVEQAVPRAVARIEALLVRLRNGTAGRSG